MDDGRIISLVKKSHFTTSRQVKTTLEKRDASIPESTINRFLRECEYRGFATRSKPLVTSKKRKDTLDFD